jgi:hypothetical protein
MQEEGRMLAHCANASCRVTFDYRLGGTFYRFARDGKKVEGLGGAASGFKSHSVQHFWLCGECSKVYSLEFLSDAGPQLKAHSGDRAAAVAASKIFAA